MTGKLAVGHPHHREYLHNRAQRFPYPPLYGSTVPHPHPSKVAAPTKLISGDEARNMEPDLLPDISLALFSPKTGTLDLHAFLESLEKDIRESNSVVRVDPTISSQGGRSRCSLRMASLMHCL